MGLWGQHKNLSIPSFKGSFQGIVMKLDPSKTFNYYSWLYLIFLMIHVGFKLHVAIWIMECVMSISFTVLINGSPNSCFKHWEGWPLHQECSLSPFLFLLIVEGLRMLFKDTWRRGLLKGIKICKRLAFLIYWLSMISWYWGKTQ